MSITAEASDTAITLPLTLDQEGVGGITGKSPTVALRDATTTDSYLDWGDSTFKVAAWGTKYGSMTEVERGHYQRSLDATAVAAIVAGSLLVAEYHVDDGGDVIGDSHEVLTIVSDLSLDVDAIWDEVLTGATHNVSTSAGKRLRQLSEALVVLDDSVVDASPAADNFDTGVSGTDSFYSDLVLTFIDGALKGQARPITTFTSANGNMFFDEPFTAAPSNGDAFIILTGHVHPITQIGLTVQDAMTAQGYTTTRGPYLDELAAANMPADLDAVLVDTTAIDGRLPSDPADESLQQAAHSATQADIAALNDLSTADVQTAMTAQGYTTTRAPYLDELAAANIPADLDAVLADTSAIDARLPSDPADESLQQASHTTTQAAIAALNDLTAQQIRDAMKLAPSAGAFASGSLDLLATEVWQLLGLEVGSPVVNTPISRKVPADGTVIDQTVTTAATTVTVSRT